MPVTDLLASLQSSLQTARKSQNKDRTLLLGTVLSAVRNHQLELDHPLTEDDVLTILQRGVKQRRESIEQFERAGRQDLAERELAQVRIIEEFLPPPVGLEEIRVAVRDAIGSGAATVGAVMAQVMPRLKGRAEGKEINRVVREELQTG